MLTVVCTLHQPGRYTREDVEKLELLTATRKRSRFICLTNENLGLRHVQTVPILNGWGWPWAKLEMFREGVLKDKERAVFFDLKYASREIPVKETLTDLEGRKNKLIVMPGKKFRTSTEIVSWTGNDWEPAFTQFGRSPVRIAEQHHSDAEWLWVVAGQQALIYEPIGAAV